MGAKAKANMTGSSNPSHDAAEAGHGHHHHRFLHGHLQHHHQAKAQPAAPRGEVDRFEGASDDINDSADAFIKRFRQQLELQRLQSIENYQQMLARGL